MVLHHTCLDDKYPVTTLWTEEDESDWGFYPQSNIKAFELLGNDLGIKACDMVRANQIHSTDTCIVKAEHKGEGVVFEASYPSCDGMLTAEAGILLCTVEADCVPVYLFDPVQNIAGMIHSGWKGTAGCISPKAVELMLGEYGSKAGDILAVTGPHICSECYEVDDKLLPEFKKNFSPNEMNELFKPVSEGHYLLNLTLAVNISLQRAGVLHGHIYNVADCTLESPKLCSCRGGAGPKRMLTAIMLNK